MNPCTVDVWQIDLNPPSKVLNELQSALSHDERLRVERLHFPEHQRRLTVALARRRLLLAPYLKVASDQIKFSVGPHGKPYVAGTSWQFNMSHSKDMAAMAICKDFEVGIDLEYWHSRINIDGLVNRVFSQRERQQFQLLPTSEHTASFHKAWTCKEAFVKAIGKGMQYSLSDIEVDVSPGRPACLVKAHADNINLDHFLIRSLAVSADCSAHLVVNTRTKANLCSFRQTQSYC